MWAMSPIAQTPIRARNRQIRIDDDAPRWSLFETERLDQRIGLHASRPHCRVRADALAGVELDVVSRDAPHVRSIEDVDTTRHERVVSVLLRGRRERGQQLLFALDDPHRHAVEIQVGEVLAQDGVDQFGQRSRGLDTGRAAADDRERQHAVFHGRRIDLGCLEAPEDVVSQPHRVSQVVEGQRVVGRTLDAEEVGGCARSHHQVVVAEQLLALDDHVSCLGVDPADTPVAEPNVIDAVEQPAHRMGDVGGVQACGRHLVEKRLERVEVVPVDDGHRDVVAERPGDGQPAEPGADDDDMWSGLVDGRHPTSACEPFHE